VPGSINAFAEAATLAGEPARAAMLHALLGGRALTAGELARAAGIASSTASGHLARLTEAGLLAVERQGRHRYHRLAGPSVAAMLESILYVAHGTASVPATGPRDEALRAARTCYDHLAGRLGVALADGLVARGFVELGGDGGVVTAAGREALAAVGLSLAPGRRALCRPCLDWSERRPHLAGALGAALLRLSLAHGWVRRREATRAVAISPEGRRVFRDAFGCRLE
jgi:DNA-binding transcriptional ArsR family regulator